MLLAFPPSGAWAGRYVADRLVDIDVHKGNVKDEKGLIVHMCRYEVDVDIHMYLLGGATLPLRSLGNLPEQDVYIKGS